jgi:hypothetical protein
VRRLTPPPALRVHPAPGGSGRSVYGMRASASPAPVTGERLDFLRALGFGEIEHDSHVPFLSHLIGTRRLLDIWGSRPALCDAGLFHSVYGTEYFEPTRTPQRDAVTAIIGAEAERIAWLWCAVRRDTLVPARATVELRGTSKTEALTPTEVGDIATLWAADTVEQIGRLAPDERGFARGLRSVLPAASAPAQRAVIGLAELAG